MATGPLLDQTRLSSASHLEDVVQSQVAEAPASDAEGAGGLLDLVRFVPGRLGVPHLGHLQVLAHLIKVLLGLLELPNIPDGQTGRKGGSSPPGQTRASPAGSRPGPAQPGPEREGGLVSALKVRR